MSVIGVRCSVFATGWSTLARVESRRGQDGSIRLHMPWVIAARTRPGDHATVVGDGVDLIQVVHGARHVNTVGIEDSAQRSDAVSAVPNARTVAGVTHALPDDDATSPAEGDWLYCLRQPGVTGRRA